MTRYVIDTLHHKESTTYEVIDSDQPEEEQPCVVISWNTATEPHAQFLAEDFCLRHNVKQ